MSPRHTRVRDMRRPWGWTPHDAEAPIEFIVSSTTGALFAICHTICELPPRNESLAARNRIAACTMRLRLIEENIVAVAN